MVVLAWTLALAAPVIPGLTGWSRPYRTLETEHIRVHYPEGAEQTASRASRIAQTLWPELCADQGYFPYERVQIVLVDHTDRAEGWALSQQHLVVISTTPGGEVQRQRGGSDWLTLVLTHELSHLVTLGRAHGLAAGADGIGLGLHLEGDSVETGGGLRVGTALPHGLTEGGAELWSEGVGATTWNAHRDALLRTSKAEGRLLTWDEWRVRDDKNDPGDGERSYVEGYAFGRYLRDRFGYDVFAEVIGRADKRLFWDGSQLLRMVTGVPGRELWADFQAQIASPDRGELIEGAPLWGTAPWLGDLDTRDAFEGLPTPEREARRHRFGTWTLYPQVHSSVVVENRGGWLYLAPVGESGIPSLAPSEHPIADHERRARYDAGVLRSVRGRPYAVDGDRLVVIEEERALSGRRWTRLRSYDLERTQMRRHRGGTESYRSYTGEWGGEVVPESARVHAVALHADTLAFATWDDGRSRLVVGGETVVLPDGARVDGLDFSPDGSSLVVSLFVQHQQDLWRYAEGAWTPLTFDAGQDRDPFWADDGWIYYSTDRAGFIDIYRVDETGQIEQITRTSGAAVTPSITPSGHLLYSLLTGHGYQPRVVRRGDFLAEPVAAQERPTDAVSRLVGALPAPIDSRPYGPEPLPPTGAPVIRADLDRTGQLAVEAGGVLRLRDALGRHAFSATGWLGQDLFANLSYTFFGPVQMTLGGWVSDERMPNGARNVVADGRMRLGLPLASHLLFGELGARGVRSERTMLVGPLARLGLRLGDPPEDPVGYGLLIATVEARSTDLQGADSWVRPELHAQGWAPLGRGRFRRNRAHLAVRADAGTTLGSDPVGEEQLFLGGRHPASWYPGALVPTFFFPSVPAYAMSGRTVVTGATMVRLPVVPRIRRALGPLYVSGVQVGFGGGAGLVGSQGLQPVADLRGELRVPARLLGGRFDMLLGVAHPLLAARRDDGRLLDPVPRVYLSAGAGFW